MEENFAERKIGGAGRNRTAVKGFADPCLTTWRPRQRKNRKLQVLSFKAKAASTICSGVASLGFFARKCSLFFSSRAEPKRRVFIIVFRAKLVFTSSPPERRRPGELAPAARYPSPAQYSALSFGSLMPNLSNEARKHSSRLAPQDLLQKNRAPSPSLARGSSHTGLPRARFIHDRSANEVAPFGPRAVVVAYFFEAQQIFQHKPGVRAALPDAAVGDDFVLAVDALSFVELLQIVERFEGTVLAGSLRPWNVS